MRTGFGRANVAYEPTTVAEVGRSGEVRIGYLSNAAYMAILEVFRGRKGLRDTLNTIKGQMAAFMAAGTKAK